MIVGSRFMTAQLIATNICFWISLVAFQAQVEFNFKTASDSRGKLFCAAPQEKEKKTQASPLSLRPPVSRGATCSFGYKSR